MQRGFSPRERHVEVVHLFQILGLALVFIELTQVRILQDLAIVVAEGIIIQIEVVPWGTGFFTLIAQIPIQAVIPATAPAAEIVKDKDAVKL